MTNPLVRISELEALTEGVEVIRYGTGIGN